jgi:hypothetical protein
VVPLHDRSQRHQECHSQCDTHHHASYSETVRPRRVRGGATYR